VNITKGNGRKERGNIITKLRIGLITETKYTGKEKLK
jgi:hypothetical protein